MKYILIVMAVFSIFLFGGCASKSAYEVLQAENEALQAENESLREDNRMLEESNQSLEDDYSRTQEKLKLYRETFGDVRENEQPPYEGAKPMELNNNPNAVNPTWDELAAFLKIDETEKIRYWDFTCSSEGVCPTLSQIEERKRELGIPESETPKNFVCCEFANMLHDNAEAEGIRAAIAAVSLKTVLAEGVEFDKKYPHVFNAFVTTDRGLVYIDCTGTEECDGHDKVVYVVQGKEIGGIELRDAISLDYDWFEEQKDLLDDYNADVRQYNAAVGYYNQQIRSGISLSLEKRLELQRQGDGLERRSYQIIDIFDIGGGVVIETKMFW